MEFSHTGTPGGGSKIPVPPAEVGIRTMASDLEAVRETGGGQPQFVNTVMQPKPASAANWGGVLWVAGGIAGAIIFFLIGYYVIFPLLG